MTIERAKRIRLISGILTGASAVLAGICLVTACVGIYRSGDRPFSREAVAQAFSPIALPVYLCLALVVLGFVLSLALPRDSAKAKAVRNPAMVLKNLRSRVDLGRCGQELQTALLAEAGRRRKDNILTAALLVLGSAVFLWFALQPGAFHQSQINGSMIRNISILFACMAPAGVWAVCAAFRARRSMEAEIALLKTVPAEAKVPAQKAVRANRTAAVRWVILAAAVICLIYGFCTGGTADVLTKAVNICTECVGLG